MFTCCEEAGELCLVSCKAYSYIHWSIGYMVLMFPHKCAISLMNLNFNPKSWVRSFKRLATSITNIVLPKKEKEKKSIWKTANGHFIWKFLFVILKLINQGSRIINSYFPLLSKQISIHLHAWSGPLVQRRGTQKQCIIGRWEGQTCNDQTTAEPQLYFIIQKTSHMYRSTLVIIKQNGGS